MTPDRLIASSVQHQVFLERFKSGQININANAIGEAEVRILAVLRDLNVPNISDLTRKQLNNLLSELRKVESKIMEGRVLEVDKELGDLAGYEAEFDAKKISAVVRGGVDLTIPAASQAYTAALARPLSATGELLSPFVKGMSTRAQDRTDKLLQKAWADGWTVQQASAALRGTKANNYRDGVTALKKRDADAIVRTAIQHTAAVARHDLYERNPKIITGYIWISTLDGVTTATCRSLDRKKFKTGQGPLPPIHINCRSATAPDLNDGLDFLDKGAERSGLFGPVDAGMTYYDWLKAQDKQFIKDTLGPARAALFSKGGLTPAEFAKLQVNNVSFQPITLKEMRVQAPEAFERAGL